MSLATQVFTTVADHLSKRADDIALYARSGYSFEEWLNWEAFAACSRLPGWKVLPKPSYRSLGITNSNQAGDVLVQAGDGRVIVEVGLIRADDLHCEQSGRFRPSSKSMSTECIWRSGTK